MASRFLLTPVGSRGDLYPFLAVGRELAHRGHDVIVVGEASFADAVAEAGLGFHEVRSPGDDGPGRDVDTFHPVKGPPVAVARNLRYARLLVDALEEAWETGRTVLVGHQSSWGTRVFEERTGARAASLCLSPRWLRSEHHLPTPSAHLHLERWPRWLKRWALRVADRYFIDPAITPGLNALREEHGLPPVRRVFGGWIHAPQLTVGAFPDWFAPPQPDWPPQVRTTGFLLYDGAEPEDLPGDLEAFLDTGEPPVAFTPGTAHRKCAPFLGAAVDACRRLGRRGLLLTPFTDQLPGGDLPPGILHVPFAPFSRLLPRCAALVHHGGIGTAAQCLAAGVPQLTVPRTYDQPDNTARLVRLGVAEWIGPPGFRGRRVARVLRRLLENADMAAACRRWRDKMEGTDAVGATCDLLEGVARG